MPSTFDRRTVLRASAASVIAAGFGLAATPGAVSADPVPGPTPPAVPGMAGDPRANEFWYQYDQRFLYDPYPEIRAAFQGIEQVLGPVEGGFYGAWASSRAAGTYPDSFVATLAPARDAIAVVSHYQLALMDEFYGHDPAGLVDCFTDFGLGVLYDPRRPQYQKVHMMDYTNNVEPPGGYHVWHAVNRGNMLLGIDSVRWRLIDPLVGYTWAVQSIAKPKMDVPHNPRLDRRLLTRLKLQWLLRTPAQMDVAFDSAPYPAGIS